MDEQIPDLDRTSLANNYRPSRQSYSRVLLHGPLQQQQYHLQHAQHYQQQQQHNVRDPAISYLGCCQPQSDSLVLEPSFLLARAD